MTRLFVDLDGVLADFDAGAGAVLGMTPAEFQQLNGAAVMWKTLAEADGFYDGLAWMADGRDLWSAITEVWTGPPPMILSGLPLGEWAQPQKRSWCARELGPGVPVLLCMSVDKHTYACAGDIRIDDREATRLDWVTAGGRFILHRSATESVAALRALLTPTPREGTGT